MNRILALALIIGASSFGLVGCAEKTEDKKTEVIKTPDGDKKVTSDVKVEATGDQKAGSTEAPK